MESRHVSRVIGGAAVIFAAIIAATYFASRPLSAGTGIPVGFDSDVLAWNHDSTQIAYAGFFTGTLAIVDFNHHKSRIVPNFRLGGIGSGSLAWSNNGAMLAVSNATEIQIINPESGAILYNFHYDDQGMRAPRVGQIAFSGDDKFLLFSNPNNNLSGVLVYAIRLADGNTSSLVTSGANEKLSLLFASARFIEINSKLLFSQFGFFQTAQDVEANNMAKKLKTLAVGSSGRVCIAATIAVGKGRPQVDDLIKSDRFKNIFSCEKIGLTGGWLVTRIDGSSQGARSLVPVDPPDPYYQTLSATGDLVAEFGHYANGSTNVETDEDAISPTRPVVALAVIDGHASKIEFVDAESGMADLTLSTPKGLRKMVFSPDGRCVASATIGESAYIYCLRGKDS